MKRIVLAPHSAFGFGTVAALVVGVAIFVFGAPPWILIPAGPAVGTLHLTLHNRFDRRRDQRGES